MNLTYLVSDYSATGEGRTVCVLLVPTYQVPTEEDKRNRFLKTFDDYWTIGMEELDKHTFEEKYLWTMPEPVFSMINVDKPPGFMWSTQIHFNFS